jgi:hypothetical protein
MAEYVYVLAASSRTYRYPDARITVTTGGHLIIKAGRDRTVAAFEPGRWFGAELRQLDSAPTPAASGG